MYEEGFYTVEGEKIFTYEYVEGLRKRDKGKNNPLCIVAQPGAQEQNLAKDVDILITGGNRGGAKSFTLLMETCIIPVSAHFFYEMRRTTFGIW